MGSNNPKRSVPFGFNTPAPQSSDYNMTDISNRIRYLQESLRSAEIAVQKQKYEVCRTHSRLGATGPGPHVQTLSSKLELERSHLKYLELVVSDFKTKIEHLGRVKLMQDDDKMEVHRLHTSSVEDNTSDDDMDGMDTPSTTTGTTEWDDDIGSRSSEQRKTASADLTDSEEEGETKLADCDSATSLREQGPGKAEAEAPTMQRLWMYGPAAVAEARPPKDEQPAILSEPRCFRAVKTHIGGSHTEPIVKRGDIFIVCGVLCPASDEVLFGYNPHNLTVGELPASSLEIVPATDLDLYMPFDQVLPTRYKSSIWMAREDFAADRGGDDESDYASSSSDDDDDDDDDDDGDDYKPYSGTLAWQEGDYVRMYHDFEKFIPRAPTGEDGSVKKPKVARPWDDCEMRVGFNLRTNQFGYFAGWSEDGWRFIDGDI